MKTDLGVNRLLELSHTLAAKLFENVEFPWQALPSIGAFILEIGPTLDPGEYIQRPGEPVWVHHSAGIAPSAFIVGPAIIDADAEVRHCAYIRGNAVVGKGCVVGNSTELKNCVLFDQVQAPHYNYVGDSILGHKAHMGAGSILSNVKSDKTLVHVRAEGLDIPTGLKKFGAILGDHAEIGCNSVLNPGTVIGRAASVYPACSVRGYVPEGSIYKRRGEVVRRK